MTCPRSVKVTAPREAKPVQICDIDVENDCIVCNHDALEIVERNLQHAGVESIAIISIMGLYRTGKSFFMDLLMRYLNALGKPSWLGKSDSEVDPDKWRFNETEMDHPGWLKCGAQGKSDRISEGRVDDTAFPWRAGAQRLTRGMWMWSAPYVVKTPKGLKGILLMDTQGAWDSEMTKDLSACVFALTAILSSKLVYNVRNSLNAQNVENLDYFTTVANVILPDEDVGRMGELQVLIRDWEHYDEGATLEQCHEEVFKHRQDFLSKDHAKNGANVEAIERLENIFSHIAVTALPHPGLIFQKTWKGDIKDINKDFIFILDRFFADLIAGIELSPPAAPMGETLNGENFASVMASTIEAFQTTPTEAINLRDAFVTLRVLRSKNAIDGIIDTKVREFRMSRLQDPSVFNAKLYQFKEEMIETFRGQIAPLKLEKEEALLEELSERLKQMIDEAATNNKAKFFGATVKLIAGPVVLLPAALALLSLPHFLLYTLIATGGAIHFRLRAGNWQLFSSATVQRVVEDLETFGRQRVADAQSISVVANRCFVNPQAVTAMTVAQATQMRQLQVIHEGM